MYEGTLFQPDRFVGGDDPATTIRALLGREHVIHHHNMRLMTLLATLIKQHGIGDTIVLAPEAQKEVPPRFGIHFRDDDGGNLHLTIVNVGSAIPDGVLASADGLQPDASEQSNEPPDDEAGPTSGDDEASN